MAASQNSSLECTPARMWSLVHWRTSWVRKSTVWSILLAYSPLGSKSQAGTFQWSPMPPKKISPPAEKLRAKARVPLCHLPVPKVS